VCVDQRFSFGQFLAFEKLCVGRIEVAVWAITAMASQYEDSSALAFSVLHAINLSYPQDATYHRAAEVYKKQREGDSKQEADEEGYQEIKNEGRPKTTLRDHFQPSDDAYDKFNIEQDNPDEVRGDPTTLNRKRCARLASLIRGQMMFQASENSVVDYLHSLASTQVHGEGDHLIPALIFTADGRCKIAKTLLQNPSRNRLVDVVKEVLRRPWMPRQTFVLGTTTPGAPFLWETFDNRSSSQENKATTVFFPARHETSILDILADSKTKQDPEAFYEHKLCT
jgi:hypothetical protein